MRLAVPLAVLALGLAGAWMGVDRFASERALEALEAPELGRFADLVAFDSVSVAPAAGGPLPDRLVVHDARLLDPASGDPVAHMSRVELQVQGSWSGGPRARLVAVHGRGGRVDLRWDGGPFPTFVDAVEQLVYRIEDLLPAGGGEAPPFPELVFDDVEVVCQAPGWALDRFVGARVVITRPDDAVRVDIELPAEGAGLHLAIGNEGLRRVEISHLPVRPALVHLVPGYGADVARALAPTGVVDALATLEDGRLEVSGALADASLRSPRVPFPLGPATIPFHYHDGRFRIDDAQAPYQGGTLTFSVDGTEEGVTFNVDIDRAAFREEVLRLVPAYDELSGLRCEDGGSFEVHLAVQTDVALQSATVVGTGGFHVRTVELTPPQAVSGPVVLQDVVGRFVVDDRWLSLPEVSARCAGGSLRGTGSLGLDDGRFDLDLQVEDVDWSRLRRPFVGDGGHPGDVAGWLQGSVTWRGVLGDPDASEGFGQLSLRAARLMDTPLIEAIVLAIGFQDRGRNAQHRVELGFDIRGRVFYVHDLLIALDVFTLRGDGTMRRNGVLDLDLYFIPVPKVPVIGELLQLIQERVLLRLKVEGRIADPIIRVLPFDVVTGIPRRLYELFTSGDDEAEGDGNH